MVLVGTLVTTKPRKIWRNKRGGLKWGRVKPTPSPYHLEYLLIKMENKITNYLEEHYPHDLDKILLADGFEDAFIGVVESFGTAPKACYDLVQCLDILMVRDNMTYDEAVEYLEFNVTQAYVGENTPAFIHMVAERDYSIAPWANLKRS